MWFCTLFGYNLYEQYNRTIHGLTNTGSGKLVDWTIWGWCFESIRLPKTPKSPGWGLWLWVCQWGVHSTKVSKVSVSDWSICGMHLQQSSNADLCQIFGKYLCELISPWLCVAWFSCLHPIRLYCSETEAPTIAQPRNCKLLSDIVLVVHYQAHLHKNQIWQIFVFTINYRLFSYCSRIIFCSYVLH